MKIQTKLHWLWSLSLGVGALAAIYLVLALSQVNNRYGSLLAHEVRQADSARVMQVAFKKQVQAFKDILLRGSDLASLSKYAGEFHEQADAVDRLAAALELETKDPEAQNELREFTAEHKSLDAKYEAAVALFAASPASNVRLADGMVKGQDRAATNLCDRIAAKLLANAAEFSADQDRTIRLRIKIMCVALLGCFLGMGILSYRTIRKLVQMLREAMDELSHGADQVTGAASQVAQASRCLEQGASQQAATIQETSSATREMDAMAQRTMEASRSTSEILAGSQQSFQRTNGSLAELIEAMDGIGSSSGKISKIVKDIEEIAFQTNILALNAAVEAARAGEFGLGFAVVADEVRNLSRRCADAVTRTAELIAESVENSTGGRAKVHQVSVAIQAITSESTRIKGLVDGITRSSMEQSAGIAQVATAMGQMELVTQSSAATAEQNAAAARGLDAQAELMSKIAHQFRRMV